MLIREQGSLIKVMRVEPFRQPFAKGRWRECVLGTFRGDEPIPPELIAALTRDEREALARWLSVYRESQRRSMLAAAPVQLESLVSALEVAAATLSAAEADRVWAQLQAIVRIFVTAAPAVHAREAHSDPVPGK